MQNILSQVKVVIQLKQISNVLDNTAAYNKSDGPFDL